MRKDCHVIAQDMEEGISTNRETVRLILMKDFNL